MAPKAEREAWRDTGDPRAWGDFYRWLHSEKLRIPTGFPTFDRACAGGLQESWLVSVCGVDQSGKSNFALSVSLSAASAGYDVGIINLDMDWRLWFLRIISKMGNVRATELLEKDQFELGDEQRLRGIMEKMQAFPGRLILDDTMPSKISQVERSIDNLRQKGAKLIVVDYLQLISPDKQHGNFVTEFDDIVKSVRVAGRETGCVMLCCAQLNRKAKEEDKGPKIFHVLGGSALERHGDINLLLDHRLEPCGEGANSFEVSVAKNRPVGRLLSWKVKFDKRTLELSELYEQKR